MDAMQGLDIGGNNNNNINPSIAGHNHGPNNGSVGGGVGAPNNVAPNSPYGGMDMDVGDIGAGELLEVMPSPPHDNSQVAAWYDTDL